jgi:hypothetical protein
MSVSEANDAVSHLNIDPKHVNTEAATPLVWCGACGRSFDPASLDEVVFHASDHRSAVPRTGIRGVEVKRD